jgi:hypothetical protein
MGGTNDDAEHDDCRCRSGRGKTANASLRVFISHRYGGDRSLYDDVIDLRSDASRLFKVQDLVPVGGAASGQGRSGGRLTKLELQAEVAARIYSADVVIAPSRRGDRGAQNG